MVNYKKINDLNAIKTCNCNFIYYTLVYPIKYRNDFYLTLLFLETPRN